MFFQLSNVNLYWQRIIKYYVWLWKVGITYDVTITNCSYSFCTNISYYKYGTFSTANALFSFLAQCLSCVKFLHYLLGSSARWSLDIYYNNVLLSQLEPWSLVQEELFKFHNGIIATLFVFQKVLSEPWEIDLVIFITLAQQQLIFQWHFKIGGTLENDGVLCPLDDDRQN